MRTLFDDNPRIVLSDSKPSELINLFRNTRPGFDVLLEDMMNGKLTEHYKDDYVFFYDNIKHRVSRGVVNGLISETYSLGQKDGDEIALKVMFDINSEKIIKGFVDRVN